MIGIENDVVNCFAKKERGCMALSYTADQLSNELCQKCKFRKDLSRLIYERNVVPKKIKGFNLIFDGENEGFFESIKAIDEWLINYYKEHKDREYMPRDSLFDDYNVLFITHDVRFKVI